MSREGAIHPLTVRAAARKIGLARCAKASLDALINRADHRTWKVPGPEGRVSVRTLGEDQGYSRRHTARGLRDLRLRGLIHVEPSSWEPNRYAINVAAVLGLADARRGQPRLILATSEQELELTASPRSDAGIPRESRRPRTLVEGAEASEAAPAPATWWHRAGARLHRPPEEVYALVAGVSRAVTGVDHTESELGTLARPVLRLWARLDLPATSALLGQVELLAAAVREGCTEDAVLHLRGLRRVGGHRGRRRGAIERVRGDHSGELPAALAVGPWAARQAAARRHAVGQCSCGQHAAPAPAPVLRVLPSVEALLGQDQPAATAAAADRWAGARQALRAQLGQREWEMWVAPLSARVAEGELRVVAPNAPFLEWVRDHYGAEIVRLVRAQVRLVVADTS